MSFKQLREEVVALNRRRDQLDRAATRDWVMPDMMHLHVRVYPHENPEHIAISILPRIWRPSENAIGYIGERAYPGGFWDTEIDPRTMTGQQLGYLLAARLLVERWVSGQLEHLPADFPER